MRLTAEDALQAYAEMINTLQISHFLPLLADDFHYASQSVLAEISSKEEFTEYMTAKLETLKQSGVETIAELDYWSAYGGGPCVVLSQDHRPICTAIAALKDGKLSRIDLCTVPPPESVTI
ncbi:hypothetical protein [Mesorhizobium koreense]|uniref:hypothetical protein n=1 Tax=Mesorhizobium koreense TaxID=3074855 RepID=UPI00287B7964|nr:hypothetical protein [Mesorhizobium sp. WR6]